MEPAAGESVSVAARHISAPCR